MFLLGEIKKQIGKAKKMGTGNLRGGGLASDSFISSKSIFFPTSRLAKLWNPSVKVGCDS